MTIVVVASRPETAAALSDRSPVAGVEIEVHGAVDDLPRRAVGCDAAVSAAGTSVWELLCLGIPTGLVCVTDNQRMGYRMTVDEGVVAALASRAELTDRLGRMRILLTGAAPLPSYGIAARAVSALD